MFYLTLWGVILKEDYFILNISDVGMWHQALTGILTELCLFQIADTVYSKAHPLFPYFLEKCLDIPTSPFFIY